MEKEEVVTELYGLRAGLSVISQNCDAVRGKEREVALSSREVENLRRELQNCKYNREQLRVSVSQAGA